MRDICQLPKIGILFDEILTFIKVFVAFVYGCQTPLNQWILL